MKSTTFETREEWEVARQGKITGSKAGKIFSKKGDEYIKGYWDVLAEKISFPKGEYEDPRSRGTRLEEEAVQRFMVETGKDVEAGHILWEREDNSDIALSPDGVIATENAAVEVKCLDSAKHIQAYLDQEIPEEYIEQKNQYFVTNDALERLYFVFFDPRLMYKDFFYIIVDRDEVINTVAIAMLQRERMALMQMEKDIERLKI